MDFATRITSLTGIGNESILSSWLEESAKEIITILPEDRVASAATEFRFPKTGEDGDDAASLYSGINNFIVLSSVPEEPFNSISNMLGDIESKVQKIMYAGSAATQVEGIGWIGSLQSFYIDSEDPGYPYTLQLYPNSDCQWSLPEGASFVSGENTQTWTTMPIDKYRLLNVTRFDGEHDLPCRKISPTDKGKASVDSGYIEEATKTDPVYYLENNDIVVLPLPTVTEYATVSAVLYPNVSKGDLVIQSFPDEFEHLTMLSACLKAKQHQISKSNLEEDIEMANSHSSQLNLLRQDYQQSFQVLMSGYTNQLKEKSENE